MAAAVLKPARISRLCRCHCILPPPYREVWKQRLAKGPRRLQRHGTQNDCFEFIHYGSVPPAAFYFVPHDGKGLFRGKSLAVGPIRRKCVINVRDLKDARGERNSLTFQSVRVPGAVPL